MKNFVFNYLPFVIFTYSPQERRKIFVKFEVDYFLSLSWIERLGYNYDNICIKSKFKGQNFKNSENFSILCHYSLNFCRMFLKVQSFFDDATIKDFAPSRTISRRNFEHLFDQIFQAFVIYFPYFGAPNNFLDSQQNFPNLPYTVVVSDLFRLKRVPIATTKQFVDHNP